jgi:hypothetical protein
MVVRVGLGGYGVELRTGGWGFLWVGFVKFSDVGFVTILSQSFFKRGGDIMDVYHQDLPCGR